MQCSTALDQIAPSLILMQLELKRVADDSTNPHFDSRYASFEAVLAEASRAANAHGLFITQGTTDEDEAGLSVVTTLVHISGQWVSNRSPRIPLAKHTAQTAIGAFTYGKRTSLAGALGMSTGEPDDDGNEANEAAPRPDQSAPAPRRSPPPPQTARPKPKLPQYQVDDAGDIPKKCTKCGGKVWDNREKKASGEFKSNGPDWSCADKTCLSGKFRTGGWVAKAEPESEGPPPGDEPHWLDREEDE